MVMTEKQKVPVWVWVVIAVPLLFFLIGIGSALAIYGVRKYVAAAKEGEANAALVAWGDGLVRCAAEKGGLPDSAAPVPASLSAVSGHKYQSASTEWSADAHTCASFRLSGPQYFQYSWERRAADDGLLDAVADINGDGTIDSHVQLSVKCLGSKCARGAPVVLGSAAGSGASATGGTSSQYAPDLLIAALVVGLGLLGVLGSRIWLIVVAFQDSTNSGLLALFVPFGGLTFALTHWEQAKRPFLAWCGSLAVGLLGFGYGTFAPKQRSTAHGAAPASAAATATATPGSVALAPLPPMKPLPAFDGTLLDVSSVMGRARKLANEWEPEAALLGLEATVQSGKIQPKLGGKAKLTFGPSPFSGGSKRIGLFVVTYDETGIHGSALAGKPTPTLPEPMCSPEAALLRVSEWGAVPLLLRYGLDSAQRPSWLVSPVGDAKQLRAFEPQACDARGTIIVRPRR